MNIAKYLEQMSTVMKIVWGGIFVVVVGFIVTSGEESSQEKQTIAYLRGHEITVDYAREACKKSLTEYFPSDVGYPTQSEADPMGTAATLTWRDNGKEFTSIVCSYHKDKGVTNLKIDGVEKLGSQATPETRKSGTTVQAERTQEPPIETGKGETP